MLVVRCYLVKSLFFCMGTKLTSSLLFAFRTEMSIGHNVMSCVGPYCAALRHAWHSTRTTDETNVYIYATADRGQTTTSQVSKHQDNPSCDAPFLHQGRVSAGQLCDLRTRPIHVASRTSIYRFSTIADDATALG